MGGGGGGGLGQEGRGREEGGFGEEEDLWIMLHYVALFGIIWH